MSLLPWNVFRLQKCTILEMLGKLIVLLGGDPRYWIIRNNRPVYWNAKYLAYATELDKALQSDIDDEHKAIEGYRNSIKLIDDPESYSGGSGTDHSGRTNAYKNSKFNAGESMGNN